MDPTLNTGTRTNYLLPYPGLAARISQSWVSHILLSILIVGLNILINQHDVNSSASTIKSELLSSCSALEQTSSLAVSLPHYLASNMNDLTASGAENVVRGAGEAMNLAIEAVEEILVFIVDTYRSMYVCLAYMVVNGGVKALNDAAQEFSSLLTTVSQGIRTDVQNGVQTVDNAIASVVNIVDKIPGVNFQPPNITVPTLNSLNNVTLPTDLLNGLSNLSNNMPTLQDLKDKMDNVIRLPFESLRADINNTMTNVTFDRSIFPVPATRNLAFCNNLDTSFVDQIANDVLKTLNIILIVVFLLALLLAILQALKARYSWYSLLRNTERSREVWLMELGTTSSAMTAESALNTRSLLTFHHASQHPLLQLILLKFLSFFPGLSSPTSRARNNILWFFNYITHLPSLMFLVLGIVGLLSVQAQLIAVGIIRNNAQDQAASSVSGFATLVRGQINSVLTNTSTEFADGSNAVLQGFQNGINNDMFGWVNITTTTLNNTLNEFYDGLTGAINSTFGGTILASAALDVVNCLIGTKIAGIEKALTFIQDNAHVTLPTVSPDVLLLSANSTNELVASITGPTSGTQTPSRLLRRDAATSPPSLNSLIDQLFEKYIDSLNKQRNLYLIFIGIWGIIVLFGIIGILWAEFGAHRYQDWRARRRNRGNGSAAAEVETEKNRNEPLLYPNNPAPVVDEKHAGGGVWDGFQHRSEPAVPRKPFILGRSPLRNEVPIARKTPSPSPPYVSSPPSPTYEAHALGAKPPHGFGWGLFQRPLSGSTRHADLEKEGGGDNNTDGSLGLLRQKSQKYSDRIASRFLTEKRNIGSDDAGPGGSRARERDSQSLSLVEDAAPPGQVASPTEFDEGDAWSPLREGLYGPSGYSIDLGLGWNGGAVGEGSSTRGSEVQLNNPFEEDPDVKRGYPSVYYVGSEG